MFIISLDAMIIVLLSYFNIKNAIILKIIQCLALSDIECLGFMLTFNVGIVCYSAVEIGVLR